ncbi:hypothetical protein MAR_029972 [Mya arenaria]|uniref:Uncharacterized protein n=1 Tax=Mya arenaria TaxID=6604 RepID=A0ABY7DI21_MYAAR|nr:hypothetical protein MAR_029972 [Mya arenaria]
MSMAEGSTGGEEGRRGTIGKRRWCDVDEEDSAVACTKEAAHDLKESPCPIMPHQCFFKHCKTIPLRPSAIQQCSSSTHPSPLATQPNHPQLIPPIQPPNLPTIPTMQPPCKKPPLVSASIVPPQLRLHDCTSSMSLIVQASSSPCYRTTQ